jgi:hypothetical protein
MHAGSLSLRALRTPLVHVPTCAPLSCGCSVGPHSPHLHSVPSFYLHPCQLSIPAHVPIPDPPPFSPFGHHRLHASSSSEPCSYSLFSSTSACIRSAPWSMLFPPHNLPISLPLCLHIAVHCTTSIHQAIRCHLARLSFIPVSHLKRARRVDPLGQCSG